PMERRAVGLAAGPDGAGTGQRPGPGQAAQFANLGQDPMERRAVGLADRWWSHAGIVFQMRFPCGPPDPLAGLGAPPHTPPMPHTEFVHLRVHSAYSLSEGAIKAEKIPTLARAAGMPAVAITDSGNLFGALEFSQACAAKGIQPIIGCQIALARADNPRADAPRLAPDPLVLLARDAIGLANLQRLSSRGFLETDPGLKPQLALDVIASHAAGLILLTGGTNGPIARLLAEGQKHEAEALLARLAEAFPDNCVV